MALNIQEIAQFWENDKTNYRKLGKKVSTFIKSEIVKLEILPEITFRVKDILSIIKKIKKKQRRKKYGYNDINDKLGIRIICNFLEEVEMVDEFIKENFVIKSAEYKKENLDFDRLDYISNHYDVTIKSSIKSLKSIKNLRNYIFEIQVRTLNQHAWSNSAHSLSYKQEIDLAQALKRKIYRLLSLYEIADEEFSAVNRALLQNPDNNIYKLLRKLEGKIYKYAKIDFDKDTSIYNLRKIMGYLNELELAQVFEGINDFIQKHEAKIKIIFSTNRRRYYEIPILTQPEIFLIWFMLDRFYFSLEDNWDNDFDHEEFEQIKILWGGISK